MCLPISPFGALMSGGRTAQTVGGGMLGGVTGALLANTLAKKKKPATATTTPAVSFGG